MQLHKRQGKIIPWCSQNEAETMERATSPLVYLIARTDGLIGTMDVRTREVTINEGYDVRNGQVVLIAVETATGRMR